MTKRKKSAASLHRAEALPDSRQPPAGCDYLSGGPMGEGVHTVHLKTLASEAHRDGDQVASVWLATPTKPCRPLLDWYADHEQMCSTTTVRVVGSSRANLFASIAAGISALWGRLHGGANQEVIEMLERIEADGGDVQKFVHGAKDKKSDTRLSGFGHRVYKNLDPRATILKRRPPTC